MTNTADNILEEENNQNVKQSVDWNKKIPIYLKLNLLFSIISFLGLIMSIVAVAIINIGNPVGDKSGNINILITSCAFFGIGYLFGLIYSACLLKSYPQSAKLISLLLVHYILNFVPVANCITWITSLIILRKHE